MLELGKWEGVDTFGRVLRNRKRRVK